MIDHLSPSSILLFFQNPAAFESRYILGIKDQKSTPAAIEGTAFHKYMDMTLNGYSEEQSLMAGKRAIAEITNIDWGKTGSVEKSQDRFGKLVDAFKESPYIPGKVIGTEVHVSHKPRWCKIPLNGYIDLVHEQDGRLILVDWKTVSSYEDKVKPSFILQGHFYRWMAEGTYGKKVEKMDFVQVKASKNEDGSPRVRTLTLDFKAHPEWDKAIKTLTKQALKEMLKKKPVFLPNLRDEYEAEAEFERYVKNLT